MDDDRLFDRSMIARLPGLFKSERLASEMSAVTRVIVILQTITYDIIFCQVKKTTHARNMPLHIA